MGGNNGVIETEVFLAAAAAARFQHQEVVRLLVAIPLSSMAFVA